MQALSSTLRSQAARLRAAASTLRTEAITLRSEAATLRGRSQISRQAAQEIAHSAAGGLPPHHRIPLPLYPTGRPQDETVQWEDAELAS